MLEQYILDENMNPVFEPDTQKWLFFMEYTRRERGIIKTNFNNEIEVSTVFLGFNHGFGSQRRLWETMIFGLSDEYCEYQERCETWEEAKQQHQKAIDYVHELLEILPKLKEPTEE